MKTEIGTDIYKAKEILETGGLVAIPTETVYGLAANALNPNAVAKIFEAKNRPKFDPLIIHISKFKELYKYISPFSSQLSEIAKIFWPGPVTILEYKKEIIPDIVTSGLPKVAVRIPAHPLTLELLNQLDFPVAAPSANPFNYVSPTSARHVYDQLNGKIDYVLDGGKSEVGVESTIIGFEEDELVIYRKGGLEIEKIREAFTGPIRINDFSASAPNAPGMLKKHYSPDKHVLKFHSELDLSSLNPEETGLLRFNSPIEGFKHQFILSESGNLHEAASRLFEGLRQLDDQAIKTIYVELVPEEGLGLAINDRLKRALAEE